MIVGRMIYFFLPEKKVYHIKATSLAKLFIWLDIFSFIVQVAGGVMLSGNSSGTEMRIGMSIYRAGIGIQQLFIVMFLFLIQKFHTTMSAMDREGRIPRSTKWRMLTWIIYAVLALITVNGYLLPLSFPTLTNMPPDENHIPLRRIQPRYDFV
jgi:hypothetical protein